jgi:ubiquinone/menaquinone biosynthesis C-methylase UbiE
LKASLYQHHLLPHLINCAGGAKVIRRQRREVVPRAKGDVLELGIGGGLNLTWYDTHRVTSLTGIDPSEALRVKAVTAPRPVSLAVSVLNAEAELLPFESSHSDTNVCTFTLCSVHSPQDTLA